MFRKRFTLDGSVELEEQLARLCERVLAGVRGIVPSGRLQAVLLGGGYGRGEGGVYRTPEGDLPYNDLEFYVCVKGNPWIHQHRFQPAFHRLGEEVGREAGLELEFKVVSIEQLRESAVSMFYYDLYMGHRVCFGPENILEECEHHAQAERIPLFEATRLMMNRCTGLLFAAERLRRTNFTAEDADFVGRNQAKAQLGFGDAVLTVHRAYHWSAPERHHRLAGLECAEELPWLPELQRHHCLGVAFKLYPQRTLMPHADFGRQQDELIALGLQVWLWLENKRLGATFATAREYAFSRANKCPETNPLRNWLLNARTFGPGSLFDWKSLRYPRERLFNALTLLLWDPTALTSPPVLRFVQDELYSNSSSFTELIADYASLWKRFS
jgi:hypothetical protein